MTKLEELKAVYEATLEASHNEEEKNQAKIADFIQGLTDKELRVRSTIREQYDIYVSVNFIDQDGKDDFASDFNISYRGKFDYDTRSYSTPEVAMDCGSSGLTTRREEPFKVERCHLMSAIWNHENELVEVFKGLSFECAKKTYEAKLAHNAEKHRIEDEAQKALDEKVSAMVKVGYTFSEDATETYWDYDTAAYKHRLLFKRAVTITKITPKRVYLEWAWVTENESQYKYGTVDEKYQWIGTSFGHVNHKQTGYMAIAEFTRRMKSRLKGSDYTIADGCDGQNTVLYEFVEESFKPVEKN